MNNKKTLYISDLDGTLLNNAAGMSDYAKNTLNRMIGRGLNFSVATARTPSSAARILDGLNINMPAVLMNGVVIYDIARKNYIHINALQPEAAAAVVGVMKACGITGLMYHLADGELTAFHESLESESLRDFVHERIARNIKIFRFTEDLAAVPPVDIINFALMDTIDRIRPAREALEGRPGINAAMYKDTYSADQWCLEIFSAEASKRNAVNMLREMYGYAAVVGFGDNYNDLPLFEACDVRVAVENAQPEVREAAGYICGPNDGDGVVKWIEANANID